MGKTSPIVIVVIVLVLVIGISAAAFFKLIRPADAQLSDLKSELAKEQAKAAELEATQQELAELTVRWRKAQDDFLAAMDTRSIPVSFAHPIVAMISSLWPEYTENLAPLIEEWVESSGCVITSGASLPAPPNVPPPAPPSGFLQIAGGSGITLGVEGSLTDIEKLYSSLPDFKRVATISSLSLSGEGARIQAQVPLAIYLLVEVAPATAEGGQEYGSEMVGPGMRGTRERMMGGRGGSSGAPAR